MKLSILVCSVHTRRKTFLPESLEMLFSQYENLPEDQQNEVEIIYLLDNKKMMLGTKRNYMVDMAKGEYVIFVDDDDKVHFNYIGKLLEATNENKDCITFKALVKINDDEPKPCIYSIQWNEDHNLPDQYNRLPNHICAIKREIARKVDFPALPYGEDSGFSKEVKKHLETEHYIDEYLYFYNYNSDTTETQQHLNKRKKRLR